METTTAFLIKPDLDESSDILTITVDDPDAPEYWVDEEYYGRGGIGNVLGDDGRIKVFYRRNLKAHARLNKTIEQIELLDLNTPIRNIYGQHVILFIDRNGASKVLKNLFGTTGLVESGESWSENFEKWKAKRSQ